MTYSSCDMGTFEVSFYETQEKRKKAFFGHFRGIYF